MAIPKLSELRKFRVTSRSRNAPAFEKSGVREVLATTKREAIKKAKYEDECAGADFSDNGGTIFKAEEIESSRGPTEYGRHPDGRPITKAEAWLNRK